MGTKIKETIIFLLLALCICSCRPNNTETVRSMYYWSTTFRIDSTKQAFIDEHHITRLYVRYFDIVMNKHHEPQPNATIRFESVMPDSLDIIPTIFITPDCMMQPTGDLADKILQRILQMNETHDIMNVSEIQIDCDWTPKSQQHYFEFLAQLRGKAQKHGLTLSTTIRLHQLALKAPPVDRGILMMYNTGDHTDIHCELPILDPETAAPYLRHLRSYSLPLATAYPLYRWDIVFRGSRYVGILHFEDEFPVLPGDSIVTRVPTPDIILKARQLINRQRRQANEETILFDLTNHNIKRFKPYEYEKILSD